MVSAFEEQGHSMVAQLMVMYLDDNAKGRLESLLGANWQRELIAMAPRVEQEVSRAKNRSMQPLQLTLFSVEDTEFNPQQHCPKNACSVGAVLESKKVLQENQFSNAQKKKALGYLMHYMVQLHVPVNTGLKRDMGGQKIYLKDGDLKDVNLAWIWNYDLYRRFETRWFSLAQEYFREMKDMDLSAWSESKKPQDWAFESHLLAREHVYPIATEGRYSAALIKEGQALLRTQLQKAAYRSALIINEALGS
ncbi:hypothetical protein KO489_08290 [Reinekea forsetii]|nr:hypothetical protein [Reinekea forsetii]